ncbi:MAG: TIGR02452 family protein [Crocinitomicaceae bacterium]|nr:TIGR02452 family protein [Crocinitomicaceae bacterium]
MKTNRADKAKETLKILDRGWYYVDEIQYDIAQEVYDSKKNTKLYSPEVLDDLINEINPSKEFETIIEVENETTMEGALALDPTKNRIAVLNFASAKNPGGGFMGGAQAQEESLARSSSLYLSINEMQEMYKFNKSRKTYVYSDYMIYSDQVVFFRNDEMELIKHYEVDVLTSPAVNVGAMMQNKRSELSKVDDAMLQRLDKMLALFVKKGVKHLVLGAWGCGVFRNDPKDVVGYFEHFLKDNGKYAGAFERIRFSVLDRNNRGTYECFSKLAK